MATTSSVVSDTSKFPFDPSLHKSIANRLEYLYEISHVPEDSKIPIIDFPIVNPYTIFNKPQFSFKKTINIYIYIYIGPPYPSTIKNMFKPLSLTSSIFQPMMVKTSLLFPFLGNLLAHGKSKGILISTLVL